MTGQPHTLAVRSREDLESVRTRECPDCGQVHVNGCVHDVEDEETGLLRPCRRKPKLGMTQCFKHGGSNRSKRTKAAREDELAGLRGVFERLGRPVPIMNPVEEALQLVAELKAWKELVRERMSELDSLTTVDDFKVEREAALVKLYTESLRDLERALLNLARLDLDERRVRISEAQAAAWGDVLEVTLRAELGPEDAARVSKGFGRRLRAKELVQTTAREEQASE